jgi:hypothetical protein
VVIIMRDVRTAAASEMNGMADADAGRARTGRGRQTEHDVCGGVEGWYTAPVGGGAG